MYRLLFQWHHCKKFWSNKIKIDVKLHKKNQLRKNYLSYAKINSVNPLCLFDNKINGSNKYWTLVSTDESKDTLKKYEELWSKTRDLIRLITNNSDYYDEKYIKIKFNSNDDLRLKKMLKPLRICSMRKVIRFLFHEGSKYYSKVSLDELSYKL